MSNEENNETPKRPYKTPRLHLFGDVRVTQGPGGGKSIDGSGPVGLKTRG